MATSTVEDYLKQILLEEQDSAESRPLVSTGRLAEALKVAPGTVTAMVKTLAGSGLVRYEPYSGVSLTPQGRQLAVHVLRRHRLIELFLVRVLELGWEEVHEEAERLEHAVSDRVIERIDQMLDHPSVDPHGDPIPNARGVVRQPDLPSLLHCPLHEPLRIARVRDQSPEFLQLAESRGLTLGSTLRVTDRNETTDTVELRVQGDRELNLGFRAASKILVRSGGETTALEETGTD